MFKNPLAILEPLSTCWARCWSWLLPGHGIIKDVYTLSAAMGKEAEKAADSVGKAASGKAGEEEEQD
jgi:hypothetical protein